MVSKAREDLPEPETPVTTVSALCGMSKSMFLRLWTRAPRTMIDSLAETDIVRFFPVCRHSRPRQSKNADALPVRPGDVAESFYYKGSLRLLLFGNICVHNWLPWAYEQLNALKSPAVARNVSEARRLAGFIESCALVRKLATISKAPWTRS